MKNMWNNNLFMKLLLHTNAIYLPLTFYDKIIVQILFILSEITVKKKILKISTLQLLVDGWVTIIFSIAYS